jgi:hypothetical protein
MKKVILKYYLFLPLLFLCFFYEYKSLWFPIHDFNNYYFGGAFLADVNFNFKMYFPYEFNKAIANAGYLNVFASYAPNTPFLAFLFLPFSFVSIAIAKLFFNCISIGLFVLSIFKLFTFYKVNPKYALLIPILFLVPIKNNLLFGQVYFLVFYLLAEGMLAYEKKCWKRMALFWSLAILLKVFPALLILFLLFKKQWKQLYYLFVSCILLLGISLYFTGIDIWIFYLKVVLPKASNGEIAGSFVSNYQSVFMFFKQLFIFDKIENLNAFFNAPMVFSMIIIAFKIGILSIGFYISKNVTNTLIVVSYWVLSMVLISPYGSTYTFILLLFPFFYIAKSDMVIMKKIIFIGLLFSINNIPLAFFIDNPFPFSYIRLLVLIIFSVLFIASFFNTVQWERIGKISLITLIGVLFLNKNKAIPNNYFLETNAPILVYDYKISNQKLTYFYWNENGENSKSMPFNFKSNQVLEVKNNQVFYKQKQLTFDISNKQKPILIDGKFIVYLSDFDRGIGFYTIRKMSLK